MKYLVTLIASLTIPLAAFTQTTKGKVEKIIYQIDNQSFVKGAVDTVLSGSQKHLPLYSELNAWSGLGNTGAPAIINEYRPIKNALNPLLFEAFDGYGTHSSSLDFYTADSPYSLINYNSGGTADKNGQTIKALFGRNLKKNGNFTFLGNYTNSDGHFSNQLCNSSAIQANYILRRKNYNLITGISRHSFKFSENGGLKSDESLQSAYLTTYLPVNLTDASTEMQMITWQGVQTGIISLKKQKTDKQTPETIGDTLAVLSNSKPDSIHPAQPEWKSLRLSHAFRITSISRKYADASNDSAFYQNTYSAENGTHDSLKFLAWSNDISLLSDTVLIGKVPILLKGGINPDFYRYRFAGQSLSDYSIGINGRITRDLPFETESIEAKWIAAGYASGDFNIKVHYHLIPAKTTNGSIITLELFANGCSADPIIRKYQSNHFNWNNDFSRQYETGGTLSWNMPNIHTEWILSAIRNKGRIYFDHQGMPAQLTDPMTVLSIKGSKIFTAGVFRSSISGLAQYCSSDAIRLPKFIGSTSTYLHHDIQFPATKGELQVEYGFDLSIYSSYFGYAYMPATGAFYVENEKTLGNYPYLNIFAQMKIKRTRIFFAWCQTLADIFPDQSFAVLHYPSMRPHLKYGIYWHFYD